MLQIRCADCGCYRTDCKIVTLRKSVLVVLGKNVAVGSVYIIYIFTNFFCKLDWLAEFGM